MDVRGMQDQVATWVDHNFPGTTPAEKCLGLAEESGEVCRAVLKLEQGIRGTREEWREEIAKELGDVFVKLCDVATAYELDLQDAVEQRWATVRARDWQADRIGHGVSGR
jgi:NTP pyrophosphatase (non-canonical NTP hydrolase)